MPRIEAVGDDVLRIAARLASGPPPSRKSCGRGASIGLGSSGPRPPISNPGEHAVLVDRIGLPLRRGPRCPSARPCQGQTSLPSRTQAPASEAPMCGQASGATSTVPSSPPGHQVLARDLVAAGRRADRRDASTTYQSPWGRASAPCQRPDDPRRLRLMPVGARMSQRARAGGGRGPNFEVAHRIRSRRSPSGRRPSRPRGGS